MRRDDGTSDHRHDLCIGAARGFDSKRAADRGTCETLKIHSVTRRLGASKEGEAMKLRGIQVPMQKPGMSGKEPVDRGEGDQGDDQTNDAVGGRTAQ